MIFPFCFNIFQRRGELNPQPGTKEYQIWVGLVTAQPAMYSLKSNAFEYRSVFETLEVYAKTNNGKAASLVSKLLEQVKEAQSIE